MEGTVFEKMLKKFCEIAGFFEHFNYGFCVVCTENVQKK